MPRILACPVCKSKMRVPDDSGGRKTRCPKCSQVLRVPVKRRLTAAPAAVQEIVLTEDNLDDDVVVVDDLDVVEESPVTDDVEVVDDEPAATDDVEVIDDEPASTAVGGGDDPFAGLDIPDDMRQDVRAELTRGETVVWVGRPSMKLLLARATTFLIVGVVLLVVGVGMLAGIAFAPGGTVTIGLSVFGGAFTLFGVAFALVRTFIRRGESKRGVYVLTNRRALILEGKNFGAARVRAYTIAQLKGMQRVDSWRHKGAGDLVFEKEDIDRGASIPNLPGTLPSRGQRRSRTQYRNHGFLMLENVKAVEKLVRETLIDRGLDKALSPEQ